MLFRLDDFTPSPVNPITNAAYDSSWIVFILTDGPYKMLCGSQNGCAYTLHVSRRYPHCIKKDGCLKSWNILHRQSLCHEAEPIGAALGDPAELRDFILFGSGATGEIVVQSKQLGRIEMDTNTLYTCGARLYFDMQKIAEDGLLVRDGSEMKVQDHLPLEPYLLWAATWESV